MKKCKLCKRLDDKFLIKGDRCSSHKCSALKKSFSRKKPSSEYGTQLNEKQKMKILYSLRERQFKNYVLKSINKKDANASEFLTLLLETRLDNVIFRAGFAKSRDSARQIVNHGHIIVNGKRINISSYQVKIGDKVSIKESSKTKKIFENLDLILKKYNSPGWMRLDKAGKNIEIISMPGEEENDFKINTASIIEFYLK